VPDHSGVRKFNDEFSLESLVTPQSQRVASSFLIDLRRHPRYETRFAAEVLTAGGARMSATVANLSRSGLLLEGSRRMAAVIFPNGNGQVPHTPASLQVRFSLPGTPGQYDVLRMRCSTVHARFVEDGSYRIGVRFVSFDKGEQALVEYLLRRAETG
jgi:hypothetical protein